MCITGLIAGTVASSVIGASSAGKAADAQTEAADKAAETQKYIFDKSVDLTEQRRTIGDNALAAMAYEMGLGPMPGTAASAPTDASGQPLTIETVEGTTLPPGRGAALDDSGFFNPATQTSTPTTYSVGGQSFDTLDAAENYLSGLTPEQSDVPEWEGFKASPGYNFRLDQGQEAIRRMAAANGTLLGGNTLKAAMEYGEGLASNEYGNWWNRLAGISQGGQQAAGQQIQAGQNYADAVGQNYLQAGNAQASGYMGMNNAFQGGMNNLFNIYGMKQAGLLS